MTIVVITPLIPVSARRAMAKQPPSASKGSTDLLGHCLMSAQWDSIYDSKSLSLGEHSLADRPLVGCSPSARGD